MNVARAGLDLAKSVFQVHGVDIAGQTVVRRRLARSQLLEFFGRLPACMIGMEACSSAHHWARELTRLGHEVRLIPPQYVKPYVKRNKSNSADAEAICEAVGRPNMRFVPIKTVEQQAVLALHRVRSLVVRQRTATINAIRGLLGEFGLVTAKGTARLDELRRRLQSRRQSKFHRPPDWPSKRCSLMLTICAPGLRRSRQRSSLGTKRTRRAGGWRRSRGWDP